MRITRMQTRGMYGTDRPVDLGKLTLLRGHVGAGKTTFADAVRVLAVGSVPAIGSDPKSRMKLMRQSAGSLEIDAVLDNGDTMRRGFHRTGESSIKGFAEASWMAPDANQTEVEQSIRGLFGQDDREARENLDLRELLNASGAERARRIEKLLDATGTPVEEQIRRAVATTIMRLANFDADRIPDELAKAERVASGLRETLDDSIVAALEIIGPQLMDTIRAHGVHAATAEARARKNDADADYRQRVAARSEMETKVAKAQGASDSVESLERRRDARLAKRAAAADTVSRALATKNAREGIERQIANYDQLIRDLEAKNARAQDELERIPALEAELAAIEEPAEQVVAPETVYPDPEKLREADELAKRATAYMSQDRDRLEHIEEALHAAEEDRESISVPLQVSVLREFDRVAVAEMDLERAQESPWNEVRNLAAKVFDLDGGAPIATRLVEISDAQLDLAPLRAALDAARQDLATVTQESKKVEAQIVKAKQRRDELASEIASMRSQAAAMSAEIDEEERVEKSRLLAAANALRSEASEAAEKVNRKAREAYAEAMGAAAGEQERVRTKRQNLHDAIKTIRAQAVQAQTEYDRAKSDQNAVRARLEGLHVAQGDPDAARAEIERIDAELPTLDAALKQTRGLASLRSEMQDLIADIEAAAAQQRVWRAAEWACSRVRDAELAARSEGLLAKMRRYLRAAGVTDEPYVRAAKGSCEFGLQRGEDEVSVETLSGGETVLFVAALAGAIFAMRKPSIRILLVEAAELGTSAPQLLDACAEMVHSGDIDQVIVSTCVPVEPAEDSDWAVVELAQPARLLPA